MLKAMNMQSRYAIIDNEERYPIVGNVCMDQMMANIGTAEIYNGAEVVLLGKSGAHEITANHLADLYGGSPYELLTSISNRVSRQYIKTS